MHLDDVQSNCKSEWSLSKRVLMYSNQQIIKSF